MKGERFIKHPWTVAVCNWLLVMAIFSVSRLFYYLTNQATYPDVTFSHLCELMFGGIRFDMTALLYLNSVYIVLMLLPFRFRSNRIYQQVAQWFYWIPNILAILVNCIDMVYMQFTGRRTTVAFFSEFQHDSNLAQIFFTSALQYWYVTLFGIAMIAVLILCARRGAETDKKCHPAVYYPVETLLFVVSIYMAVIGIRGGFGAYTRPITLSNALQYTNRTNETNIVLNTPFCLMRSTEGRVYTDPHYYDSAELETIMTPLHEPSAVSGQPSAISGQRLNVVVFILESFSSEYIGFYNNGQGYTPFLDSLLAQSVTWQYSFASGRKSIDAMPSVLSSIPMLIAPYVVTPYSTNSVSSIADCLGGEGYTTAFFHGAPNGSMGFQAYARSAGFQAYYGQDEYPNARRDFDGTWAIWDEEFLQFYAQTMSTMPEPFMTAVFTASSHHPFKVPARYEGVFPTGPHPIHQCIGYSDHALRRFFGFAQTQDWYDHTLFVITADHTNQLTLPEYTNDLGRYRVPVAFFCPALLPAEGRTDVISQTDIMPSVLEFVGYDKPYFAFGEDALSGPKKHNYAICYNSPVYQVMNDSLLMQFDGQRVTALYNYKADPVLHAQQPVEEAPEEMVTYLKAYIQQYIHRMIHDQLTHE